MTVESVVTPFYSFDGGEDWIRSISEVTLNGAPLTGVSTTDLSKIDVNDYQNDEAQYLISPLPEEGFDIDIEAENIIIFNVKYLNEVFQETGTLTFKFVIKANGYVDVPLEFDLSHLFDSNN
ncbi:MAG: hypothetical protein AB2374_06970 [Cytobacillus gottheilii]|uniref:hemoblobin-interacting domain-containing protein n=1 Tax=Cytobacillus gottheilii TaxID=859144 RepID=UPI0034639C80